MQQRLRGQAAVGGPRQLSRQEATGRAGGRPTRDRVPVPAPASGPGPAAVVIGRLAGTRSPPPQAAGLAPGLTVPGAAWRAGRAAGRASRAMDGECECADLRRGDRDLPRQGRDQREPAAAGASDRTPATGSHPACAETDRPGPGKTRRRREEQQREPQDARCYLGPRTCAPGLWHPGPVHPGPPPGTGPGQPSGVRSLAGPVRGHAARTSSPIHDHGGSCAQGGVKSSVIMGGFGVCLAG
jgi:hypothetical protein